MIEEKSIRRKDILVGLGMGWAFCSSCWSLCFCCYGLHELESARRRHPTLSLCPMRRNVETGTTVLLPAHMGVTFPTRPRSRTTSPTVNPAIHFPALLCHGISAALAAANDIAGDIIFQIKIAHSLTNRRWRAAARLCRPKRATGSSTVKAKIRWAGCWPCVTGRNHIRQQLSSIFALART